MKDKISIGRPFEKGLSQIFPRGKKMADLKMKGKLMTEKQRLNLQRKINHFENTKDNPPLNFNS